MCSMPELVAAAKLSNSVSTYRAVNYVVLFDMYLSSNCCAAADFLALDGPWNSTRSVPPVHAMRSSVCLSFSAILVIVLTHLLYLPS